MKKTSGGIGITIRGYEKKGKLVVQVGNVAAIAGRIPSERIEEKQPRIKLPRNLSRQKYVTARGRTVYYYFAQFLDSDGKNKKIALGTNYKAARDRLLDVLAEHQRLRLAPGRSVTFSQWASRYLDLISQKASAERDRQMAGHLKSFFGDLALTDITTTRILEYKNRRLQSGVMRWGKATAKKVQLPTVQRELSCLRAMLNLAAGERLLRRDELPRIRLESEERFVRERVLKDDEYEAYLRASPLWFKRISVAAYETAMSRKDLTLLNWERVDRKAGVIRGPRMKSGKRQLTPITKGLAACLDEVSKGRGKHGSADALVFTNDGKPITKNMMRTAFDNVVKAAGIANFHFHDFRHTAKTRWARHGITPEVAMLAAGQKSLRMHYRYVDLTEDDVAEAFKDL